MADGKRQPQQSAETTKASTAQSAKREALLTKAKERIDKVDVADDQKHDSRETEVKKKALEFVSNECLTLPEDRFFKLIDAIEIRMKQKEAYKQNLVEEFKKVRKEIADSIVQTGLPIRENAAVSNAAYEPKKLFKDMGDNLLSYPTTAISNLFDPEKYNATYDVPMLEVMEKYPKSADQFYNLIRKDDARVVGFLMHWGPNHPAFKELQARGMARAIEMVTKVEARLRSEFWVPRNSHIGSGDRKEATKLLAKRVSEWKAGDKFNAAANEAADMFNFDRKLFTNKFASHPKGMSEEQYTKYVKRSANYLEYAASKGESGKREFFEQLEKDPEIAAGFIVDWNENSQIFQVLSLRGKTDTVAIWVSRLRNEAMRKYGIAVWTGTSENRDTIRNLVRFALNRTDEEKAGDRAWVAKEAFSGNDKNDVRSARYFNYATASGSGKEWAAFVATLKSNPKQFAQFIYAWNENSPLGAEIKRNNGADAVNRLNELKRDAKSEYSIPEDFKGSAKQHALAAIEAWLKTNAWVAEKRAALTEKIKESYPEHRKYVEAAFAEMRQGVLENKWAMVEKAKQRLVKFSNETLLPLHNEASKLPGYSDANGKRFIHPQLQQVASLRVAIEAMNVIKLSDTGEEWFSDLKKVVMNDANKTWVDAKAQQVSRILDGGDFWAVVGFGTEFNGAVRVQKPLTGKQFDDEIRNKDIQDVDSEAFYQAICQANVLGELTAANLIARWGEFRIMKIALHWGIVKGGKEEQKFNKSGAFVKLQHTNRQGVATAFENALKEVVSKRDKDMERLDAEKADLKAVKEVLKKIKPGITEADSEKTIAEIKQTEGTSGLRVLEKLKGSELKAEEIESFFSALHKIQVHEVAASEKRIKESVLRQDEIAGVGEFQTVLKAAEASYAKTKSQEDKGVIDLLKSGKFREIGKSEDPRGQTPRPRKMGEISPTDVLVLAKAAGRFLPETSRLREYLSAFRTYDQQVRKASSSDTLAKNSKVEAAYLVKTGKLTKPEAAKEDAKFDKGLIGLGAAESVVKMRQMTGTPWAPTTKEEKDALSKAAKDVAEAEKNGIALELGDHSALKETYADRRKGKDRSLSEFLADVAEGKEPLNKEQAEVWKSARGEGPRTEKDSGARDGTSDNERPYGRGGILMNSPSVESFMESKPGEQLRIGDSVTAVKTEGGWLEVFTASRKLRFNSREAEGAVQQIDLLKEAGAEFLIPAMNEIAFASQTQIKDGVGRAESARILSTLSRAFGFDSVTKETDPKLMLEKFKSAASGASGDGGIWAKARSLWILDPANNALKSEVLVERMSGILPARKETSVQAAA